MLTTSTVPCINAGCGRCDILSIKDNLSWQVKSIQAFSLIQPPVPILPIKTTGNFDATTTKLQFNLTKWRKALKPPNFHFIFASSLMHLVDKTEGTIHKFSRKI